MILLDTDHVSILTVQGSAAHDRLNHRLQSASDSLGIPIVCLEEQCNGWLAKIHRGKNIFGQMEPYRRLEALFVFAAGNRVSDMCVPKRSLGTRK